MSSQEVLSPLGQRGIGEAATGGVGGGGLGGRLQLRINPQPSFKQLLGRWPQAQGLVIPGFHS